MSFRGSSSDEAWTSRKITSDLNSPVILSRSRPKSALTSLFGDFHEETSAFSQMYINHTRHQHDYHDKFENDQEFFCLRKLIGRPRVSYATEEKKNLDSIKSSRIDTNGHKSIYNGKNDALMENSNSVMIIAKRKRTQRRASKDHTEPQAKIVSSSIRKVRYNHLEYDRFMPPPDLIDGPKVYCPNESSTIYRNGLHLSQNVKTPLWYHPIFSVDEKIARSGKT